MFVIHVRHLDVEIDPVEKRSADALAVAGDLHRIAPALTLRIPIITTRTGIAAGATPARKIDQTSARTATGFKPPFVHP